MMHNSAADNAMIDSTARIHPDAVIEPEVTVGAFCVVGAGARVGTGSVLADHAVIRPGALIGPRCRVDSFAVLGGDPQDLGFDPATPSHIEVGAECVFREGVTVHRSTEAHKATVVDSGVLVMAGGHIAHDCHVGDRAVLANNVLLAGHVHVEPDVTLGGAAGIHQFTRIGTGAMVAGNSTATCDVPPYTMVVERNGLIGLNRVKLRRSGVQEDEIADLKHCYRAVYSGGDDPCVCANRVLESGEFGHSKVGRRFLEFFAGGTRGFVRPRSARLK